MRRTRGLTLIEIMIVVAIVSIVFAGSLSLFGVNCGLQGSGEHAEQEARSHAQKLGWKVAGAACTGRDTDGDGYISCTVALEDGTERALECASGGIGRITGCKAASLIKDSPRGHRSNEGPLEDPGDL